MRRALGAALESIAAEFDGRSRLDADPLGIVRSFPAHEREVVAHIAAPLAYGAVTSLRTAISAVLGAIGPEVTESVRSWRAGEFARRRPDFVYRMTRAEDVDGLLVGLGALLRRHGSLLAAFRAADAAAGPADDLQPALAAYVAELREAARCDRRGFRYLAPDPTSLSACKRWHLMLRWLVRPDDGVDLGLWTTLGPHRLLLPLDTHTARHVRALGLSRRATVGYAMARDATRALARIDPDDPVRFDMALCHLGISGACRHTWVEEICGACGLRGACALGRPPRSRRRG